MNISTIIDKNCTLLYKIIRKNVYSYLKYYNEEYENRKLIYKITIACAG